MPRQRRGPTKKAVDLGKIVNSAIEEGIDAIIDKHPRFSEQEELLAHYLDKKTLNHYAKEATEKLQDYTDEKQASKFIGKFYDTMAGYVASGELFTDKGKEIILRKSWGEKSRKFFTGGTAREILDGEQYLDDTMNSFRDLYKLFKTGDYSKRMPQLAEAVATVYDMGFADAAVNVLYENGLMNQNRYKVLKKVITQRTKEGVEKTQETLTEYIVPEKIAASILGIIGLGILLTSNPITGNIIGVSTNINIGAIIFGVAVLGGGVWMFFRNRLKRG